MSLIPILVTIVNNSGGVYFVCVCHNFIALVYALFVGGSIWTELNKFIRDEKAHATDTMLFDGLDKLLNWTLVTGFPCSFPIR